MKVGVVGSGFVGATAAYAMVMDGVGRQIVLVDRDPQRAEAEANDITHAVPFAHPLRIRAGDYDQLQGSQVVVIAAGVGQKPGETRLQLLQRNAAVFGDVIPRVIDRAPDAVLVVATNPVDVMTAVAARLAEKAGLAGTRVLGSGTTLDTARFRSLLGDFFDVDSHHVHAYVIGEHGDSEVLTWSSATIGGMPLDEFTEHQAVTLEDDQRQRIDRQVRRAAYNIIEGKGATYYGIGSAIARIVDVILHDQRSIMTVCSRRTGLKEIGNTTLSMPSILGGAGVLDTLPLNLDASESRALEASAAIIREATESVIG